MTEDEMIIKLQELNTKYNLTNDEQELIDSVVDSLKNLDLVLDHLYTSAVDGRIIYQLPSRKNPFLDFRAKVKAETKVKELIKRRIKQDD